MENAIDRGGKPSIMQSAVDLTAAAMFMSETNVNIKFVKAVFRMRDVQSAEQDLIIAVRMFELGLGIISNDLPGDVASVQDRDTGLLAGALFSNALMIYARIVTNNNDRGRVPLEEGAPEELKLAHTRMVELRHSGVGHFAYGRDHPAGAVASDRVLLMEKDDGFYINSDWIRSNYKARNISDLNAVLKNGIVKVHAIKQQRTDNLSRELNALDEATAKIVASFKTQTGQPGYNQTTLTKSGKGPLDN